MKMKNIYKKNLYSILALILFAAIFTNCSNSGGSGGGSEGGLTTYTVTYDGNGATGGTVPVDSTNYEEGQNVTVQGNTGSLVKTGYTFSGWNTAADGSGTTYTQGQNFTMGSAGVILYARWTTNPTYTVTYDGNGATGGTVPVDSTNYEQGQNVTILGNTGALVKSGDYLVGWNTAADGSGTTYTQGQSLIMGTANVVLYAKWTDGFVTTWKTDNPGTSGDDQITIPIDISETYDYSVDWGDDSTDSNLTAEATHTYTSPGTYTVVITGTFPRIYFNNTGDREKILTIENWGIIGWETMASAFSGCTNLTYNAIDAPDLSSVTDMSMMFWGANSFNGEISGWNVSSVTNMRNMFWGASSFNGDISGWDVSSVINMSSMFFGATSFNRDISGWIVSSVTNMRYMFTNAWSFNGDISGWDVSSVINMSSMFMGANSFNGDISGWIVSSVTDMSYMFYGDNSFNQNISGWIVSSVTDMSYMFRSASSFNQDISGWDVSSVTDMSYMFYNASAFDNNSVSLDPWGGYISGTPDMTDMFVGSGLEGSEPSWY